MKILLITLLFFSSISFADNFLLFTHEQFLNLNSSEQKLYINEVRKVIFALEESNHTSFKNKSKWTYLFELIKIQEANATATDQLGSSRIVVTDPREENARISHMHTLIFNLIKSAYGPIGSEVLRKEARDTFNQTLTRIQNLSKKDLTAEQKANLGSNVKDMKDNYDLLVQKDPSIRTTLPELQRLAQQFPKVVVASEPRKPRASKLTDTKPAVGTTATTPAAAAKPPATATASAPAAPSSNLRCIYAGFVIKKTRCEPNQILPDEYSLKEITDKNKFKCANESDVLCNPLVFGFKSVESPYCTSRSSTASRNCEEQANNTENLARIQKVWKNPENKKVYESFHADLKKICNQEQKNKDILATCPVVISQFNKIIQSELPVPATAAATPAPASAAPSTPARTN